MTKDGCIIQARISLDLILIENLVQILAHYLLEDGIPDPGRGLIVVRELLRGIALAVKPDAREKTIAARFEVLGGEKLNIRIQTDEPAAGGGCAVLALKGTGEYNLARSLVSCLQTKENMVEATVSFQ